MGSSPPSPPDPYEQANAQSAANREASISSSLVNNPVSQNTPWGNQTHRVAGHTNMWTQGADGQWQQVKVPRFKTDFQFRSYGNRTPGQEAVKAQAFAQSNLARTAQERSQFLKGFLKKGVTTKSLPRYRTSQGMQLPQLNANIEDAGNIQRDYAPEGGFSEDRRRVEDAMMARYDEAFARDQDAMRDRLASEGLMPGSEGWNERMAQLDRAKTDARMQAILAGGQEQSRMLGEARAAGQFSNAAQSQQFGQNAHEAQFGNQVRQLGFQNRAAKADRINAARQAMLQERLALRNQPLNEISALMSSSQVTTPQFAPLHRQGIEAAQPAQYMQDAYNAQLQAHQAQQQGLFGLAGGAMQGIMGLMSDRRVKTDIEPVGKLDNGLTVYSFRYKHGGPQQIGLMADEVEKIAPDAVKSLAGIKHVDYAKAVRAAA